MKLKGLKDEDFVNYKKPSMFLGTAYCDWKCCTEQNLDIAICQNSSLASSEIIDIPVDELYHRYISNPITEAVVVGGLEPIMQISDVLDLIQIFRNNKCFDDFIIYTGYYPNEIKHLLKMLKKYKNIIIKFGRYIPKQEKHYDKTLGVWLASNNQWGEQIS